MEELRALSEELGYPGAQKLWAEARRRDIDVTRKVVDAFSSTQGAKQVLRPRPPGKGRFWRLGSWTAGIDYNATPSPDPQGGDPYQYILIVQDIFSRKLWAHALKSKAPAVAQQAFEAIVRRAGTPDNLGTDNGNEFKGPFQEYLVEEQIHHDVADPRSRNARATWMLP